MEEEKERTMTKIKPKKKREREKKYASGFHSDTTHQQHNQPYTFTQILISTRKQEKKRSVSQFISNYIN
jgi:hypothetical protein